MTNEASVLGPGRLTGARHVTTLPGRPYYRDFDIKLYEDTYGTYRVEAIGGPGERSDPVPLQLSLTDVESPIRSFRSGATGRDACERLGRVLFKAMFPPPIKALWHHAQLFLDASSTLRVRLDIRAPELASLPWELLSPDDEQTYPLALSSRRPITRCLYDMSPPLAIDLPAPMRVLAIVSSPEDTPKLRVDPELTFIHRALKKLEDCGAVELEVLPHTTIKALSDHLQRGYDVVHYVGHGQFAGNAGYLVLEDEHHRALPLDGRTLGTLLFDTETRLFVVNACESAHQSHIDPLLGIAQATLRAGVPAVVAMQGAIANGTAAEFSNAFYAALATGNPLELCVSRGRRSIVAHTGADRTDWAIPVLFSNITDGVIFDPFAAAQSELRAPVSSTRPQSRSEVSGTRPVKAQIPVGQYDDLVGRDAELRRILELMDDETHETERVIVICGAAGVGSSSLAKEVGRRCVERGNGVGFAGVVWAPTRRLTLVPRVSQVAPDTGWTSGDLYEQITAILQVPALLQAQPQERWGVVGKALREDRYLVVLDDVDELRDMRFEELLDRLPPPTRVIATTHSPLSVDAYEVNLQGLSSSYATGLWRTAARAVGAEQLVAAADKELEEIVTRTGGAPLALRLLVGQLADAHLTTTSVHDLLAEAPEQPLIGRLLRRAIAGLSDAERDLLGVVALHPYPVQATEVQEGFGLGAADSSEWATRLSRLALVWQDGERVHLSPRVRRAVLNGLERTSAERLTGLAVGHDLEQLQVMNQLGLDRVHLSDTQLGNALWAAERAYELQQWDTVLRFRWELDNVLFRSGDWTEGIRLGEWAFDAADRLGKREVRAWCGLYPLGRLYFYQQDFAAARTWCERSLDLFRLEGLNYGVAYAKRYLGRILEATGQPEEAARTLEEGLEIAQHFGSTAGELNLRGDLLASLASLAEGRGDYRVAHDGYSEALMLYQRTQSYWGEATTEHRLGSVALEEGDYPASEEHLTRSQRLFETHPWPERWATVMYTQAMLAERRGDTAGAEVLLRRAYDSVVPLSAPRELALVSAALARLTGSAPDDPLNDSPRGRPEGPAGAEKPPKGRPEGPASAGSRTRTPPP